MYRLVAAALFMGGFVANMNLVATGTYLSPVARELDLSVAVVGQTQTAALVIGAIVGLLIGPLSDQYGIRRVLIAGAAVMAVCGFATAAAVDFWTLMLARIPGGLAFGMIMGLGASVANTRLPPEQRRSALGWIVSGAAISVILGAPLLATVGDHLSWRFGFMLVGAFGLALIPGYLKSIPADPPPTGDAIRWTRLLGTYAGILADRRMFGLQAATIIWGLAWAGANTYLGAFAIDEVGASLQEFGYIFMLGGTTFLMGSRAAPYACRFWSPRRVMLPVASLLCLAIILYFTLPNGILALALVISLLGIAGGAGLPLTVILVSEVTDSQPGSVMMLRQFCYGVGSALGAASGGLMLGVGGYTMLAFGLGAFAVVAGLLVFLATRLVTPPETGDAVDEQWSRTFQISGSSKEL